MKIVFALLLSFIAPIILLPVEQILNYPHIIEEAVKLLAVTLIIFQSKQGKKNYLMVAVLVGVLFTISESVLYLVNSFQMDNFSLIPQRIIVTGILHSATCVLIYILGRKSWWLLGAGFVLAVLIHYYFNIFITSYVPVRF